MIRFRRQCLPSVCLVNAVVMIVRGSSESVMTNEHETERLVCIYRERHHVRWCGKNVSGVVASTTWSTWKLVVGARISFCNVCR